MSAASSHTMSGPSYINYIWVLGQESSLKSAAGTSGYISFTQARRPDKARFLRPCNLQPHFCMQVAQLSGYVSEQSAYHHGEASLQSTIVGMAQNFVGSNNINYLVPSGVHCPTTLTPLAGPEVNVVASAPDFGCGLTWHIRPCGIFSPGSPCL